jgi:hypothetical protein
MSVALLGSPVVHACRRARLPAIIIIIFIRLVVRLVTMTV